MKEVLVRTKPKDSFTLVVSDNSGNIQTTFNPPLYLQVNRDYGNAESGNVLFIRKYSKSTICSNGLLMITWTFLHIPTGCYELKAINAEIIRLHGNSVITILPNVNMLQCIWLWLEQSVKLSFDVPNFLASVLCFKQMLDVTHV